MGNFYALKKHAQNPAAFWAVTLNTEGNPNYQISRKGFPSMKLLFYGKLHLLLVSYAALCHQNSSTSPFQPVATHFCFSREFFD